MAYAETSPVGVFGYAKLFFFKVHVDRSFNFLVYALRLRREKCGCFVVIPLIGS